MSAAAGVARREELHRQGVRLKAFAVAWNAVWAVVAVGVGVVVGCVALVGFGAGSRVGIISAMALLWRLLKAGPHAGVPEEGAAEGKALHLVAATVFLLALYITYEAAGGSSRAPDREPRRLLHDLGKLGVAGSILHNAGPLAGWEVEIVQGHPDMGRAWSSRWGTCAGPPGRSGTTTSATMAAATPTGCKGRRYR